MGQKPTETGPIAGEPALMNHIGYALELINKAIDERATYGDIEDLIKIHYHLINAKYARQAEAYYTEPVGSPWEKAQDGSCEGEIQAEAEAERQADAALELSAELASCDWGAWE
jgi:hypothetical protein